MHHVDIVIPIYNAYEDLEKCLDSIYKNTNLEQNRLILINDNSTDDRIREFLDKQETDTVIVIHNETNQGFSHNVNLGMAQSDTNDVLLLNSDTVVTKNWIEKMVSCAYSDKSIGTVTPLSNNATLCSVPEFCEENSLPENMTVGIAAEIVERVSLKRYPYITVAHGFCMLIKREVINAIGNFDEETFQKGYGEENDFCNRAGQLGYRHVMCDDTYILHTGTKSFINSEKAKLIEEHDRILRKRYPTQMHENDVHVRDNPNRIISQNIGAFFDLNNGRKNILYVVQADFRDDAEDHVGGTQLHVKNLTYLMKYDYNIFVSARDREFLNLTLYIDEKIHSWRFYIGPRPEFYSFYDKRLREIWEKVIDSFRIDLVHVHHLLKTSFDIVEVAKEKNLPVLFTLHDYFMACPSEKLLDENFEYLSIENENEDSWKNLLKFSSEIYEKINYIKIWRQKAGEILKKCDLLIVPNKISAELDAKYYPQIADKLKVLPHGYEFEELDFGNKQLSNKVRSHIECINKEGPIYKIKGWAIFDDNNSAIHNIYVELSSKEKGIIMVPTSVRWRDDICELTGNGWGGFELIVPEKYLDCSIVVTPYVMGDDNVLYGETNAKTIPAIEKKNKKSDKLNVAFIGGINIAKGGNIIHDIVTNKKSNANYFIFGDIGAPKLASLKSDNLCKFGRYNTEDLPAVLNMNEIDIVCILSIWPETYSYTLSEALLCDKLVIVTDIGALGDRVKAYTPDCCVPVIDAANNIVNLVNKLSENRNLIQEYKKKQKQIKVLSIDEMAVQYKELYTEYHHAIPLYGMADYKFIANNLRAEESNPAPTDDGFRAEFKRRLKRYIKSIPAKSKHKAKHVLRKMLKKA